MNIYPPTSLMVGVDLLFSFSFVFSWVSTCIQVSFQVSDNVTNIPYIARYRCWSLMSQTNIYWNNHEHIVSHESQFEILASSQDSPWFVFCFVLFCFSSVGQLAFLFSSDYLENIAKLPPLKWKLQLEKSHFRNLEIVL